MKHYDFRFLVFMLAAFSLGETCRYTYLHAHNRRNDAPAFHPATNENYGMFTNADGTTKPNEGAVIYDTNEPIIWEHATNNCGDIIGSRDEETGIWDIHMDTNKYTIWMQVEHLFLVPKEGK